MESALLETLTVHEKMDEVVVGGQGSNGILSKSTYGTAKEALCPGPVSAKGTLVP